MINNCIDSYRVTEGKYLAVDGLHEVSGRQGDAAVRLRCGVGGVVGIGRRTGVGGTGAQTGGQRHVGADGRLDLRVGRRQRRHFDGGRAEPQSFGVVGGVQGVDAVRAADAQQSAAVQFGHRDFRFAARHLQYEVVVVAQSAQVLPIKLIQFNSS